MSKMIFKNINNKNILKLWSLYIFISATTSCNISKHVEEDKLLIKKVDVEMIKSDFLSQIDMEELKEIMKVKSNRKILNLFRFHLRLYNFSNTNRIQKKALKRVQKTKLKNQKIESNNNQRLAQDSTYKKKPLLERKLTLGEKFQRAGEAPSIYSELINERSKIQLKNYLFNKGFFEAIIEDSISLKEK